MKRIRRQTNFILYITLFLLCTVFITCKKKIEIKDNTASGISYYQGNLQDKVQSVIRTNDGGFLFIGNTIEATNTNGFLLKVDQTGKQEWYKTYESPYYEFFTSGVSCTQGGYLIVGQTNSIGFDTTHCKTSGMAMKISSEGNIEWQKAYSAVKTEFYQVIEKKDHTFLITGKSFVIETNFNGNLALVSIDENGKQLFSRTYGSFSPPLPFTNGLDIDMPGNAIQESSDGSLLIGGFYLANNGFKDTSLLPFIMQTAASGLPMKNLFINIGFASGYEFWGLQNRKLNPQQTIVKILPVYDGYLFATSFQKNEKIGIRIIKTNLSANLNLPVWEKQFFGMGNSILYDFCDNGDGSYYIIGTSTPNKLDRSFALEFEGLQSMVSKIDGNGNEVRTQFKGSENNANVGLCTQVKPDGKTLLAGYTLLNESGLHQMFTTIID